MNKERLISIAQIVDIEPIFDIFIDTRSCMTYLPEIHTTDETHAYITQLVTTDSIHIAKENGVITGFMQVKDDFLHHLYIAPQFQNKGYGKQLLDKAKALNPTGLQLWVFEENLRAIKFYEREGFQLVEKRDKETTTNEENLPDRRYTWNIQTR